jgi:hypothetical protein
VKHKVYCCGTDADYHIPFDDFGVRIYFDIKSVKAHEKCWEGCGIAELELDCPKRPKMVVKANEAAWRAGLQTMDQAAKGYIKECIPNILKVAKREFSNAWWGVKELRKYYWRKLTNLFRKR